MDNFKRKTTFLILWLFIIILYTQTFSIFVESQSMNDPKVQEEQPSYSKLIQDTISTLKDTHQSYWEKVKETINELQSQFLTPNLESSDNKPNSGVTSGFDGAGEKIKEGVEKSFKTSKETLEESAKSAADGVGKTVQNTANKVKGSTSENEYKEEL